MSHIKIKDVPLHDVEFAKRGFLDVVITNYDKNNKPTSYETTFVLDTNKQPIDNENEED